MVVRICKNTIHLTNSLDQAGNARKQVLASVRNLGVVFFQLNILNFEIFRLIRNCKNIEFPCTLHPAFPNDNILYNHSTLSKPEK